MGRPLNKKYFGNRNIGSTGTGDNYGIGGEGIASINWSTLGSFIGNAAVAPITVPNLPAPTLPGGVQATWSVLFEVESVTTGAGKTDLAVGDTFTWASVPGLIAKVTDLSGANAIFSVTTTGASRGSSLTLAAIPQDSQTITMTQSGGTGTAGTFVVDVLFRVASVAITEKGSGYNGTETFTFTKPGTTSGTVPAGTITLTTDSGAVGSATNQENAIIISANVGGEGGQLVGDIIRQTSSRRYKIKTDDGIAVCKLVGNNVLAAGEAFIRATDSNGNTYFVTKLTAHRARLIQWQNNESEWKYADGAAAPWKFAAPVGEYVQIENA